LAPVRQWDPVHEVEELQDRMGQLMQRFVGPQLGAGLAQTSPWLAPVDIEETDDVYVVELDVPSVKHDDLDLELRENTLRISGEINERERVGVLRRQTRRVGQFDYMVALPGEVDPDKVDATLHDGVLTVRVGRAAASQPRRIEIKSS
jgi:HSP20 family protein